MTRRELLGILPATIGACVFPYTMSQEIKPASRYLTTLYNDFAKGKGRMSPLTIIAGQHLYNAFSQESVYLKRLSRPTSTDKEATHLKFNTATLYRSPHQGWWAHIA